MALPIDAEMMGIMVDNWLADRNDESFELIGKPYYDEEFGHWHQDIHNLEDGKTYTLVGYNDGNVYLVS